MDQLMTKEESYVERRQLFKNIWDTAMTIDDKDPEIMNKPKVIKTLRLSDVDRCIVGKKKKQRIRNLRTVCKKILDFCDRQDADDMFYEKIAGEGPIRHQHNIEEKHKKVKPVRIKKKIKKTKSLSTPLHGPGQAKATISERKDNLLNKTSKNTPPTKIKRTTLIKNSKEMSKEVNFTHSPRNFVRTSVPGRLLTDIVSGPTPKVIKKKLSRRKKVSGSTLPLGMKYKSINSAALNHNKRVLEVHKINIA